MMVVRGRASIVLVVGVYGNYIVTPAIQANHLTGACSTDNRPSHHENNILNKKHPFIQRLFRFLSR